MNVVHRFQILASGHTQCTKTIIIQSSSTRRLQHSVNNGVFGVLVVYPSTALCSVLLSPYRKSVGVVLYWEEEDAKYDCWEYNVRVLPPIS